MSASVLIDCSVFGLPVIIKGGEDCEACFGKMYSNVQADLIFVGLH